jgi:hypothetical protein
MDSAGVRSSLAPQGSLQGCSLPNLSLREGGADSVGVVATTYGP